MLSSIRKCLISIPKSGKNLVLQLNILRKVIRSCKRSKSKRAFAGFDGLKASFASMELSNQLELVFEFIDANGDGKISVHELSRFLMSLGHDKSKVADEAAEMLRHMDSNGDGFVDLNEYMHAVMIGDDDAYDGYVDEHYNHFQHDSLEDDLKDAFVVFDYDKNGLISARELHHVLKRLGFANCSMKECSLMIKGVDKNGDGYVNFAEFKTMMMSYVR